MLLPMSDQARLVTELRDLIAKKEVVLVVGTGVSAWLRRLGRRFRGGWGVIATRGSKTPKPISGCE